MLVSAFVILLYLARLRPETDDLRFRHRLLAHASIPEEVPRSLGCIKALHLDGESDEMTLVRLIEERVEQRPPTETPIPEY